MNFKCIIGHHDFEKSCICVRCGKRKKDDFPIDLEDLNYRKLSSSKRNSAKSIEEKRIIENMVGRILGRHVWSQCGKVKKDDSPIGLTDSNFRKLTSPDRRIIAGILGSHALGVLKQIAQAKDDGYIKDLYAGRVWDDCNFFHKLHSSEDEYAEELFARHAFEAIEQVRRHAWGDSWLRTMRTSNEYSFWHDCKCVICGTEHAFVLIQREHMKQRTFISPLIIGSGSGEGLYRKKNVCLICHWIETTEGWQQNQIG